MALTVAPLSSAVMGSAGRDLSGVASGVNNAVARAGGLLAVAALGLLLVASYRGALGTRLDAIGAGAAIRQSAVRQASRLTDLKLPGGAGPEAGAAVKTAFGDAFGTVALTSGALGVLGGVAGFFFLAGRRGKVDGSSAEVG
jgi:hypothetical protein